MGLKRKDILLLQIVHFSLDPKVTLLPLIYIKKILDLRMYLKNHVK
jgi:hypothetical protein